MRSRINLPLAALLAIAAALTTSRARATDCTGPLNACVNDDIFWPHAGPSRFVAIGSSETIAAGQIGFDLVTSYLSRPIALSLPSPGGGSTTNAYAINDQVNGTFLWSYGVADRLELDLALPLTFGQGGTGLAPVTGGPGLKDTAIRDMRFGFAYAIVPHLRVARDLPAGSTLARRSIWGLVARLEVSAPTGDRDQFAGERSAVFVPSLAGDVRVGRWFAGVEFGARVRPTTELLGTDIGTQLVTAVGLGYDILRRELLTAVVEAWALPTFSDREIDPYIVPSEWQLSARSAPLAGGDVSIQLGGGGALPLGSEPAVTAPRFRFTLGLRWAPLARDTDGDGVPDGVDRCPMTPGAGSRDGCPETLEPK